ncbi:MAG: hypothetical protein ABI640_11385 [Gammaproteobacteria bacterium]
MPRAGVGFAALAAQAVQTVARRDHLAHRRAQPEAQASAAEQQVRDEAQEGSIDVRCRLLHRIHTVTVTAKE